ncbi:MAG: segregation/condensation protein A [Pseudomonadota bacterium]
MPYNVKLEVFEGPLDLLLHLIKKNEIDIYDIPIASITFQYLEYLDIMKNLNLDIAGEFLVMAATLMYIKSRMLLPPAEDEREDFEAEGDPRAELVKRLIEYQKFKDTANKLMNYETLNRDVFARGSASEVSEEDEINLNEISIIELIEAFKRVLKEEPPEKFFYVAIGKMSVNEKIIELIERMKHTGNIVFQSLFTGISDKHEVILTFLAILELIRLRIVRVIQATPFGTISICPINLELPKGIVI